LRMLASTYYIFRSSLTNTDPHRAFLLLAKQFGKVIGVH
jgi:hypothetical protein